MEESKVIHVSEDSKYRVSFEQSATKGIIGFKVEAHGDDKDVTMAEATILLEEALRVSKSNAPKEGE